MVQVTEVLEGQVPLTLRSRLRCILAREEEGSTTSTSTTTTTTPCPPAGRLPGHMVMNDVVIDRGPSPYLCNLDLYLNGVLITSVQVPPLPPHPPPLLLLLHPLPGGRPDPVHPHGEHGVRGGGGGEHGPPLRAHHHGHPHLPTLPLLQVHILPPTPQHLTTPTHHHHFSTPPHPTATSPHPPRPFSVPAGVELKVVVSPEARNSAWVSYDGRSPWRFLFYFFIYF